MMHLLRVASRAYNNKVLLVFIFFLSVFTSITFFLFLRNIGPTQHQIPGTDYLQYYEPLAQGIVEGRWIPVGEQLGTRYPPGYPLILSGLFFVADTIGIERLKVVVAFNIIATALESCLLFLIARLILNKRVALIAAFLWMTYPFNLWLTKNPQTEVPFILFLYLALLSYLKGVQKASGAFLLLSGALIGGSALIRPVTIFLPAVLIFFLFLFFCRRERFFRQVFTLSLFLLAGYFLVVMPWVGYVYATTGKIIPLAEDRVKDVTRGLTDGLVGMREGGNQLELPSDVIALVEKAKAADFYSLRDVTVFLLREFGNQPFAVVKLIGIKAARAWYGTSQFWWEKQTLFIQLLYLIPALLGVVLWWQRMRNQALYLIFFIAFIGYFLVFTMSVYSILRYMIPAMGLVMIFSAVTVDAFAYKIFKNLKI